MDLWKGFVFNAPYTGKAIEKISNVFLPMQYIEFMKKHNGGAGDIGETWLELFSLEELQEANDAYCIEDYLPNHIIIGTNGNGELYGIDIDGNYFNVPVMMEIDEITELGKNIETLPEKINALWK